MKITEYFAATNSVPSTERIERELKNAMYEFPYVGVSVMTGNRLSNTIFVYNTQNEKSLFIELCARKPHP